MMRNGRSTSAGAAFNGPSRGILSMAKYILAASIFAVVYFIFDDGAIDGNTDGAIGSVRRELDTSKHSSRKHSHEHSHRNSDKHSTEESHTHDNDEENDQKELVIGWVRPDRIFGLIHMAKTAGTEINGELANHYERVCGNKGYSYSAYNINQMHMMHAGVIEGDQTLRGIEEDSRTLEGYDGVDFEEHFRKDEGSDEEMRRKVVVTHLGTSEKIGFDDCDYIAEECGTEKWKEWSERFGKMELHLPCRDPLEHLMSQCNFKQYTALYDTMDHPFNCQAKNLTAEVENCLVRLDGRFDMSLLEVPDIDVKCFNPIPVRDYVDYMGTILQHKRIESEYFHMESNVPRDRDSECIWKGKEKFHANVLKILMKHDYYKFCSQCMGSENELDLSREG